VAAAATLFINFIFFQFHTFIITFIQYINPSPFAEASLHFFIACCSEGKPPWDSEPSFELGPAIYQASALPTELRSTLKHIFISPDQILTLFWEILLVKNTFYSNKHSIIHAPLGKILKILTVKQ
jgi:hypothetical protein